MRIDDLENNEELSQLTESIKFGNKEIAQVMRRARDFRVGIEYEFRYNDDMRVMYGDPSPNDDAISYELDEMYNEYAEQERRDFEMSYGSDVLDNEFEDFDDELKRVYVFAKDFRFPAVTVSKDIDGALKLWSNIESISTDLPKLYEAFGGGDELTDIDTDEAHDELRMVIDIIYSVKRLYDIDAHTNGRFLSEREYDEPVFNSYLYEIGMEEYEGKMNEIVEHYQSISKELKSTDAIIKKAVEEVRNEINPFLGGQLDKSEVLLTNTATLLFDVLDHEVVNFALFLQFLSDVVENGVPKGGFDGSYQRVREEMIESAWEDFGEDQLVDRSTFNEQHIDDAVERSGTGDGIDRDNIIEHIVENTPSISDSEIHAEEEPNDNIDIEIITDGRLHDLSRALEVMEEMFDYIETYGETNQNTGMHVNMSVQGADMTKMDKVKLLVLLNNRFMLRNFKVREHVSDLQQSMKDILKIREAAYRSRNPVDFIETFVNDTINFNQKHQGVSFTQIFPDVREQNRRIEFRYLGDKDYHRKYDELEWNIQRYAYMMLAALDEEFERDAYLRGLWRMVNTAFEEAYQKFDAEKLENLFKKFDLPVLAKKARDLSLPGYIELIHTMRDYGMDLREINTFIGLHQSPNKEIDEEEYKEYRNMFLNSGLKGRL